MPTVEVKANQVVFYKKTIDVPKDELQEYLEACESGYDGDILQWMANGDSGFQEEDIEDYGSIEDLEHTLTL